LAAPGRSCGLASSVYLLPYLSLFLLLLQGARRVRRFGAGEGGGEAERDQHFAGKVALRAAQARAAANAFGERASEQRVNRIAAPSLRFKRRSPSGR